ncbi:mechanosensitive ion channel family protein [soil metagenome]
MAATEFQKKAISFIIFVGIAVLVLATMPLIEDWFRQAVLSQFGMVFLRGWELTPESAAVSMTASYANAFDTFFHILRIVLWMAVVISVVRFVAFLILRAVNRGSVQSDVSSLIKTVSSIVIYIVAFFLIFETQYPNVSLAPLFTGSTILGIVVGLALQDTLGNLFAGLALQADKPFQVGDVILITGRGTGVIESVSWRGIKIRTFQNKLLLISNAVLGKESIEVAPKENLNARLVMFSTVYHESPANTAHLVRESVRLSENVSPKIRPIVRIRELAADGLEWEVKYWLEDYSKYNDSDALVRQRIWYTLHREKIDFAYPTRTVYIKKKEEEASEEEIFDTISEHLNRVSIFTPLSDEEIMALATASKSRIYAPGEPIVRRGQQGNSMFVIIRGSVKVQIPEVGYNRTVNTLGENDFFGEMSLLTGEPRSANVIAVEETEVLRIDKNGLKPIFESNPQLVESIYELIEERKNVFKPMTGDETDDQIEGKKGVMRSIKKFFGLNK